MAKIVQKNCFFFFRFCAQLVKETHSNERSIHQGQPAHRIYFLPSIKVCNLLPIDLNYNMLGEKGRIGPGASAAITTVSLFMV